jgi:hypothetical protein
VSNVLHTDTRDVYERTYQFYEIPEGSSIIDMKEIEQNMKVNDYLGPCQVYELSLLVESTGDKGQFMRSFPIKNATIVSDENSYVRFGDAFAPDSECQRTRNAARRGSKSLDVDDPAQKGTSSANNSARITKTDLESDVIYDDPTVPDEKEGSSAATTSVAILVVAVVVLIVLGLIGVALYRKRKRSKESRGNANEESFKEPLVREIL